MTPNCRFFQPTAVALALASLATGTLAQQAPSARGDEVQSVTVTATRRSERLQDVPLSVSAATAEQIQSAGVSTIQDIAKVVSGVTFGSSPSDSGFRVRGVGTLGGFTSASEQPVGVVIDGVVMGLGPVLENMVDVERLEVLKGPQGTQFGKNASSGAVSITTRKPVLGKLSGMLNIGLASLNERDVSGTLNLPLGSTSALRVSLFNRAYDGFIENKARNETWGGMDSKGGRAKLLVKPSANLELVFSLDATRTEGTGPGQLWTSRLAAPGRLAALTALGITPGPDNQLSGENARGYTLVNADGAALEVNYKLGDYTLTSVTAHRNRDGSQRYGLDSLPTSVFEGGGKFRHTQDSQEVRVTSPRGPLEYVAGVFFSKLKSATADSAWLQPSALGAPAPPPGVFVSVSSGVNRTNTDSESTAVFGDGKLRLGDSISLLAGLRVTQDKVSATNVGDASAGPGPEVGSPPGFLAPPTARAAQTGQTSASKLSGRIGAEWKPSKQTLVYATMAQGYLGPTITFSGQQGLRSDVKAQTVDDVTLGFKTELLDRKLTVNASVFQDQYKNLQVGVYRAATNEFITENAGAMTSKGVEIDISARLARGLSGRASLTYVDAKFKDYITQCPATGDKTRCYTPAGSTTSLYQAAGDVVPGAPQLTSTLGLDYGTSVGNAWLLDASFSVSYRSKTSFGVGELSFVQDGYAVANAGLRFGPESERWSLGLWGRNLFDTHYQAAVIGQSFAPPGGLVNWNTRDARRSLGATLTVKY